MATEPRFSISIDINAPAERVFDVMTDVERWHEWTPSVTSVRLMEKGPLAIGSRAWIRQPKFPPALWQVTVIEPPRRFVWRSGLPGMWVYGHHSVEERLGGGTRATLRLHYEGLLGSMLARLTRGITERYLGYEAAGLKKRSESIEQR